MPDLPYQLKRSRRKTLSIQIRHSEVTVRAPLRLPLYVIHDFIRQKEPWIKQKLSEQADKLQERCVVIDAGWIPVQGELKKIRCLVADKNQVELNNEELFLHLKAGSRLTYQQLFEQWLSEKAKEVLTQRTQQAVLRMGVQHKFKELRFRKTRSKWGHCSRDGIIQFNWLILMAPNFVIDYIVAHEVCHLLQFDHSKQFWAQIETLYGDYRPARQWLKNHGHTLYLN